MKGTMNIIDALAIAPYYIDLFFMPPPNLEIPEEGAEFGTTNAENVEEEIPKSQMKKLQKEYNNQKKKHETWLKKNQA